MLTERLRMLEEAGILLRVQEATIPPKVSYSFTQRGHELEALLDEINALALRWSMADPTDNPLLCGHGLDDAD